MKLSRTSALSRFPLLVAVFWGLAAASCVPPLPLGPLAPLALAGALLSLRPLHGWAAVRFGLAWGLAFHAVNAAALYVAWKDVFGAPAAAADGPVPPPPPA